MAEEKDFENVVKDYLTKIGAWYVKYWAGSKYTKPGIPDLLCCYKGIFVAIEIKAEKGKVSTEQEENIQKIEHAGGVAIVLRPSGFDDFVKIMDDICVEESWK